MKKVLALIALTASVSAVYGLEYQPITLSNFFGEVVAKGGENGKQNILAANEEVADFIKALVPNNDHRSPYFSYTCQAKTVASQLRDRDVSMDMLMIYSIKDCKTAL